MIVDMGIPILIEYHVDSVLPFFPTLFHSLLMLVISLSFLFQQSAGQSSTWGCLILTPWSGRGWHVFSYVAGTLGTCHKGLSYQWCSLTCIYIKFDIHLLCFFRFSQFNIRQCVSLSHFFWIVVFLSYQIYFLLSLCFLIQTYILLKSRFELIWMIDPILPMVKSVRCRYFCSQTYSNKKKNH